MELNSIDKLNSNNYSTSDSNSQKINVNEIILEKETFFIFDCI